MSNEGQLTREAGLINNNNSIFRASKETKKNRKSRQSMSAHQIKPREDEAQTYSIVLISPEEKTFLGPSTERENRLSTQQQQQQRQQ